MRHTYWKWDRVISDEICDEIIKTHKGGLEKGTVANGGVDDENLAKVRSSNVNFKVSESAASICRYYINTANRLAFGFDLGAFLECQFTQYLATENGHYDWHPDNYDDSDMAFDRKLSCIVMLSDPSDYEGGGLSLGMRNEPVRLQRGSVVVFPSFLVHKVYPVTSGERYTLVAWAEGPMWR